MTGGAGQPEGLLESLRSLGRTLIEVIQTRLAILGTEIEEERLCIARLLLLAAIAAVCFAGALALAVLFVVVLFWDYRLAAIGILCVTFLAVAIGTLVAFRSHSGQRPRLFSATLAELEKDRAAIDGRHGPPG